MGKFLLTEELLLQYQKHLYEEERATATIKKYICDLKKLKDYASGREITKELMVRYKEELRKKYKVTSINSFLVAANRFLNMQAGMGCASRHTVSRGDICAGEQGSFKGRV